MQSAEDEDESGAGESEWEYEYSNTETEVGLWSTIMAHSTSNCHHRRII